MNKLKQLYLDYKDSAVMKVLPWIIILVLVAVLVNNCQNNKQDRDHLIQDFKITKDSVNHFRDQNGVLHNRVQSLVLYGNEFKKTADLLGLQVEEMQKKIKSLNGLVAYYKGSLESEQPFMFGLEDSVVSNPVLDIPIIEGVSFHKKDTVKTFFYTNKYLTLRGIFNPKIDSIKGKYIYTTGFEVYFYHERKKLFGPKLLYADFILEDKSAKLIDGKALLLTQPKRWYETTGVKVGGGVIIGGLGVYGLSQLFKK